MGDGENIQKSLSYNYTKYGQIIDKKPTQGSRIHSVKITVDFVKTFTA